MKRKHTVLVSASGHIYYFEIIKVESLCRSSSCRPMFEILGFRLFSIYSTFRKPQAWIESENWTISSEWPSHNPYGVSRWYSFGQLVSCNLGASLQFSVFKGPQQETLVKTVSKIIKFLLVQEMYLLEVFTQGFFQRKFGSNYGENCAWGSSVKNWWPLLRF